MEKLLTVRDVASLLQCHRQSVYRNKELPIVKIPGIGNRYKEADLNKYLEQKTSNLHVNLPQIIDNQSFTLTNPPDCDIIISKKSGGISELAKAKSKTRINLGYGAIYQRKIKSGKIRWYLDYMDAEGNRIQKVASRAVNKEEAALALRSAVLKEHHREYGIKEKKQPIKFADFVYMFIENYSKVNKKSWKDDYYRLQKCIRFFGNIYLHEMAVIDIEKLKSVKLEEGLTKTTINHYLKILKRLFNIAIEWGYVRDNPLKRIKFYSEKDALKERILTEEEEICLLEAASEHLKPILVVALNTGMRRGEILNLTWNRIDLEKRNIQVVNTKSGRNRIIPINRTLFEVLIEVKRLRKSEYVFPNLETEKPYKTIRRSFKNACRRAGIKELRMHDCRHTFASRLVERGVDIVRVKELLGHSTVKITERYTHSSQEERSKAVELLCEKSLNRDKKEENLLHNCDMQSEKKEHVFVSSLFSVN